MAANDQKALTGGMAGDGTRVELPFTTAFAWVLNGLATNKQLVEKKVAPTALYFGGLASDKDGFELACASQPCAVPSNPALVDEKGNWLPAEGTSRDGKTFQEYVTRNIFIAPFARRTSFFNQTTKERRTKKFADARFCLNVVGMGYSLVAEGDTLKFVPWMPIIVSAKGTQAFDILTAWDAFKKASVGARKKLGGTKEAETVYVIGLGTFGADRIQKIAGKEAGKQSPVTPLSFRFPETVSAEWLEKRYVGDGFIDGLKEMVTLAAEWQAEWKVDSTGAPDTAPVNEDLPYDALTTKAAPVAAPAELNAW